MQVDVVLRCEFRRDSKDSKSTSVSWLCVVGSRIFGPISWLCKQQGAVSHSSTEAEIVALDIARRLGGLPAMGLRDSIVDVLDPKPKSAATKSKQIAFADDIILCSSERRELLSVANVPPQVFEISDRYAMVTVEDNDAVIKMRMKVEVPTVRHTQRIHRVDVDAFSKILMRFKVHLSSTYE